MLSASHRRALSHGLDVCPASSDVCLQMRWHCNLSGPSLGILGSDSDVVEMCLGRRGISLQMVDIKHFGSRGCLFATNH